MHGTANTAAENLVSLMTPHAVLLLEGMDLGLRSKLSERHGLRPAAETDTRQIDQQTRVHTPQDRWNYYFDV
jgi:hypothetical protein